MDVDYRFIRNTQQYCRSAEHRVSEIENDLVSFKSLLKELNMICEKLGEQRNE